MVELVNSLPVSQDGNVNNTWKRSKAPSFTHLVSWEAPSPTGSCKAWEAMRDAGILFHHASGGDRRPGVKELPERKSKEEGGYCCLE